MDVMDDDADLNCQTCIETSVPEYTIDGGLYYVQSDEKNLKYNNLLLACQHQLIEEMRFTITVVSHYNGFSNFQQVFFPFSKKILRRRSIGDSPL